ncbi:hypothetical protein MLD38_019667 [Melastoma candidum]|uniref:Uncharacterized protein n=1 Tax=Melastoma candidum TaxID=119954 RepID=A0ACB9QXM8_9MYRT|nr:hypothetical protein MLD38_019667 [Melastoma candidum]
MARSALCLLLLLLPVFHLLALSLLFNQAQASALPLDDNHLNPDSSFIRSACRATLYPALCVRTLSAYTASVGRNDLRLSQAALLVSLSRARSTTSFVARLVHARGISVREFRAVKDCIENMGDSVDGLTRSVSELAHLGKRVDGSASTGFTWHMSNVQTWVSAALTDENTCMDGFGGRVMDGNIKVTVRRRVVHLARVTSNALALVNRFASRHRA